MEKETAKPHSACASCSIETFNRICMNEKGKGSPLCPTLLNKDVCDEANMEYSDSYYRKVKQPTL